MAQELRPATWVWGKVEPGWYMARGLWNAAYTRDQEDMGYVVCMSVHKPTTIPAL